MADHGLLNAFVVGLVGSTLYSIMIMGNATAFPVLLWTNLLTRLGAKPGPQPEAGQHHGDALKADAHGVADLDAQKAGEDDLHGYQGGHHRQVVGCEQLLHP